MCSEISALFQCMAKDQGLTNVLLRKVVKSYGTGKLIEGVYEKGQRCLVVEDVMVSGQGIYEACEVRQLLECDLENTPMWLADNSQNNTDYTKEL